MLIDAHAHLDKYGADLDAALEEIERCDIFTWAVSMDLPSYRRNLEIAARSGRVLPTFGVHPRRAPEYADRLRELSPWIERSPAIGEIGLDFHWVEDESRYPAQKKVLEYFLAAAKEQDKIVNLHTKGAEKEILDLLVRYDIRRAVVHWYSGPLDVLDALIDYGAYFTFGVETMTSANIRSLARAVPLARMLTETDNPGGLKWLNGAAGMPGIILQVIEAIAAARHETSAAIIQALEENFRRLAGDDPWLRGLADRARQP
ncbi:MAG TPA: TatD family hydrolase [Candidatus Binatia bacterium]|jgi:TatD DNase family protein